jgi:hypothetical protein
MGMLHGAMGKGERRVQSDSADDGQECIQGYKGDRVDQIRKEQTQEKPARQPKRRAYRHEARRGGSMAGYVGDQYVVRCIVIWWIKAGAVRIDTSRIDDYVQLEKRGELISTD